MSEHEGPAGPQGEDGPQGEKGDTGDGIGGKVIAAFVLVVLVATLVSLEHWRTIENVEEVGRKNSEVRVAVCEFRDNLSARARSAQMFLDDVKAGRRPPIQGVSVNDLERSLESQKSTLRSFRDMTCEDP